MPHDIKAVPRAFPDFTLLNLPLLFLVLLLLSGCAASRSQHSADPALPEGDDSVIVFRSDTPDPKWDKSKTEKNAREEAARLGAAERIIETAKTQLGVRYRYGGNSPETGFDCSGFASWVFAQHGIKLPRSSREQMQAGIPIDKRDLRPGDLLIYSRRIGSRTSTHAGIYIGDGKFIHSPSSGKSISIDQAFDDHYSKRFLAARRVILNADEVKVYAAQKQQRREFVAAGAEHRVKRGETLSAIAMKYGVTVRAILEANNLKRADVLQINQKLRIPGLESATAVAEAPQAAPRSGQQAVAASPAPRRGDAVHVVKSGDSIWTIAQRHGLSEAAVLAANDLPKRHTLRIGQKLVIPGKGAPLVETASRPEAAAPSQAAAEAEVVAEAPAAPSGSWSAATPEPQYVTETPLTRPTLSGSAQSADRAAVPAPAPEVRTASAPKPEPKPQAQSGGRVHVVKSGDTAWSIAKQYSVSKEAVLQANNLQEKHVLQIGQKLRIPEAGGAARLAQAPEKPQPAKSQPAKPQAPAKAQTQPAQAQPQAQASRTGSAAPKVHSVQSGDTIWSLARKHGVSPQALLKANNLSDKAVLSLGQKLLIPVAAAQ